MFATIYYIKDKYKPNRRFRRSDSKAVALLDESTRIQSTLLEYGMYVD